MVIPDGRLHVWKCMSYTGAAVECVCVCLCMCVGACVCVCVCVRPSTHGSSEVDELLSHVDDEVVLGHEGAVETLIKFYQLPVHLRHLTHTHTHTNTHTHTHTSTHRGKEGKNISMYIQALRFERTLIKESV